MRLFGFATATALTRSPTSNGAWDPAACSCANATGDEWWYDLAEILIASSCLLQSVGGGGSIAAGFDNFTQMLVAASTATADDIDAEFADKFAQGRSHRLRFHWIDRLAR